MLLFSYKVHRNPYSLAKTLYTSAYFTVNYIGCFTTAVNCFKSSCCGDISKELLSRHRTAKKGLHFKYIHLFNDKIHN